MFKCIFVIVRNSDETLNNAKQKEKMEMDSSRTCTDAPSDRIDFSLSKNLRSNVTNNLEDENVDSFHKETPILNSIVDAFQNDGSADKARDAEAAATQGSETVEKRLLLRPESSSKQDNADQMTTDSGIDLISSPPYAPTENIYDGVGHFDGRRRKPPEKDCRKPENDVEFLHKIGRDLILEMGESIIFIYSTKMMLLY